MKVRPDLKLFWLALFAAALPRPAGAAQMEASGYLKEFYRRGRSPLDHRLYWLSLTRARLTLENASDLVFDSRLKLHLDYDHELRTGTFLKSPEFKTFGLGEPPGFWDLERTVSARGGRRYRHLLYRAWAGLDRGADQIRAGRQRIAWGTGKLWNPTDFINPYQPTAPERDERRGVDAFSWRRGFGALSQGTLVYTFAGNWSETDLLGRFRSNARGVDLSLMGGKVSAASSGVAASASSWMAGGDFSFDVWDGNLHGEATYTDLRRRSAYWKTLIGYEYMFPVNPPLGWLRDVWVLGEYYHNGAGASAPAGYNPALLSLGREVALARDYLGFGVNKELHPLVKIEVYQIINLTDSSVFLSPSVSWNALKDLYLIFGWQSFGGRASSEYGGLAELGYFQAEYFF